MNVILYVIAIQALVFGLLGTWVAMEKGRLWLEGAILGVVFSAFGVLVEGLLPVLPEE